jgi:ubiquinone/menaquinone biosynthesis C-methylase UbiE
MLLKIFFDLLYHSLAWGYDLIAWLVSFGRWQSWVKSILPYIQGQRVLEMGYGPGHLLIELKKHGYQVVGLDESHQMARIAGQRMRRACPGQPFTIVRGIGQELPFASSSLDSVVATFPAPYILEANTLTEISRTLKPDGQFIIILAVWIIGKRLGDRALALLYRTTGETPVLEDERIRKMLDRYQAAGFTAEVSWIEQSSSRLMMISAQKRQNVAENFQ